MIAPDRRPAVLAIVLTILIAIVAPKILSEQRNSFNTSVMITDAGGARGVGLQCENRVPTLNEISRLNDPVLSEVFASSGIKDRKIRPESEDHPQLPPMEAMGQMQTPVMRMYETDLISNSSVVQRNVSVTGEVPIDHNQPLGPNLRRPDPMSEAVDTGVHVLANGANALYRGATSVGQAFGFNAQAYEAPLFNAASQFFGRK